MGVTAFNPLDAAQDLETAGIESDHAVAVAKMVHQAVTADDPKLEKLATKDDLNALKVATKDDLNALKAATKDDLNALKAATKDDLNALKVEVKDDLNALKVEVKGDLNALKVDIRSLEARMYRALWVQGGAIVAAVGTIVGVVLAALRFLPGPS